jgi:group I intron endonuclease
MLEIADDVIEVQKDTKLDDCEYVEIRDPYGFIYISTNLINGKRYLGQKIFDRKWKDYLGSGSVFKHAVKKYGKENFSRDIIHVCYSPEELNAVEYDLSVLFNVVASDDWYNVVLGGGTTTGMIVTEETRKKQSVVRKMNSIIHPEYDEHHSKKMIEYYEKHPEAKEQHSDRMKQLWKDENYIEKMSQYQKNYWSDHNNHEKQSLMMTDIWKDPNVRDVRLSGLREWTTNPDNHDLRSEISKRNWDKPGFRENQIKIHSGSNNAMYGVHRYGVDSPKFIPVYCIELQRIFWGAKQVEVELHIKGSDIAQCCKKVRGHNSAGKHPVTQERLHWMYAKDAIQDGYITQEQLDKYIDLLRQKGNDTYGTMEEK